MSIRADLRRHLQAFQDDLARVEAIPSLHLIEQGEYPKERQDELQNLLTQIHRELTAIQDIIGRKAVSGVPIIYGLSAP